jgi:hypothetical protein
MDGTCSRHGRDEICVLNFSQKAQDLGVDQRIILKCILKKWDGRVWTKFI